MNAAASAFERESVYVHLARVKMLAGRLDEARNQLTAVTNQDLSTLKANLLRAIGDREKETRKDAPGELTPTKP